MMNQDNRQNPTPAAPQTAPVPLTAPQWQQPVNPYAQPPVGVPIAAPQRTLRRSGTTRDTVMAVILALLSFAMTDCIFWSGTLGLGFAASAFLLMIADIWYLAPVWRHTGFYTAVCILLFGAGDLSLIISDDSGSKFLTLVCMMILYGCILMDSMRLRQWTPGTFDSVGDFFYTFFGTSFGKIGAGMYGLFHREKSDSKHKSGVGKALLGLLIALPLAAILIVLLSSADEAFHGMIEGIDLGNIPEKFMTLLVALPVAMLLFCQVFSLRDIKREVHQESDRGLDPTILTFFLIGISAVYVAYLFSQLAYFFSGFSGFLPKDFTYAQYARRGFFELTAVSVINILIVILGSALSRKKDGRLPLGVKLTMLFLCLFSLVLVGTEVAKMKMYIDAYGMTRLRILTTLFMVFLAVVFLALAVYLFARKFPYLKIAVVCGVLLTIAVNFVSVDRMVAQYNVWAYQSGVLNSVDVDTITELGDAAVPSLLQLAEDEDDKVARQAKDDLYDRWKGLHAWGDMMYRYEKLEPYDWRGYNSVSYEARRLLLENEELFAD